MNCFLDIHSFKKHILLIVLPLFQVVHYKEFIELIQPFKDPERVPQLDSFVEEHAGDDDGAYVRRVVKHVHGHGCKKE